jgi:flagellar biosynthesis/type III secretory pathway protein FliH
MDGLQFVLVELQKFDSENVNEHDMAGLWLKFLREIGEGMAQLPEDLANNEQTRKAAELCREAAFSADELAAYEAYWDIIRTELTLREGALAEGFAKGEAKGFAKGEAKGLAEGEAKGLAEGEAKGLAEGEAKRKADKVQIVINSHKAEIDIETISRITNLPLSGVVEIIKNQKLDS